MVRSHPESLFQSLQNPLTISRDLLRKAGLAHQKGDYYTAEEMAISAYLDGFEIVENTLDAQDNNLRQSIETNMMTLRRLMKEADSTGELEVLLAETMTLLDQADRLLSESTLSRGTLFTASLIILLREGLEALLVVIALLAILTRANRRDVFYTFILVG